MKRLPRNRVIETVLEYHMDDIEEWVLRDKTSLKLWLVDILELKRMKTDDIMEKYSNYFESEDEDDPEEGE